VSGPGRSLLILGAACQPAPASTRWRLVDHHRRPGRPPSLPARLPVRAVRRAGHHRPGPIAARLHPRRRGPRARRGRRREGRRSPGVAAGRSHPRRGDGAARRVAAFHRWPARRARGQDADQVPGRPAGVRLPGRLLAASARDPGPGRPRLRHAAVRRVHPSVRIRAPRRHAGATRNRRGGRLPGRARRQRCERAGLVRRTAHPFRPARHRPGEHGRRLRRPLRAGGRAEPGAGGPAHPALASARQRLRGRGRQRHPGVQGRLDRTTRWTCSWRTSSTTRRAGR